MVPNVSKVGGNFKGALAYYLHDKRENAAAPHPTTSERVSWTETRNMATEDMHTALRVMVATAKQADELKARAGIPNTGRKSTKSVYSYSLSWHPDEAVTLTRDEMVRAANDTLKLLGAENRQAVIVCHTDQDHPHVHVIVNRVDPENGCMLEAKNDRYKLSDWANQSERGRGRILTPRREEKREQREQNADKADRRKYAEQQRAAAKERAHDTKSRATMLRELGVSQKVQHADQWRDLAAREKVDRNAIYRTKNREIAATIEMHRKECKPIWAQHFHGARAEERRFAQREKSMSGVVVNAFVAARHQQTTGQLEGRGLLAATIMNVFSSRARQEAFAQAQDLTRQQLASRLKSIVDREIRNVKGQRNRDLASHRDRFKDQRKALMDRQGGERAKLREAWKQLYGDRSEWSPRQGDERGTKPYRADGHRLTERRDEQSRTGASFDRKAEYHRYQQQGAGKMAEGKAFATFEEKKRETENIVREKNDAYRQKEQDGQTKLTTENRAAMEAGVSQSKSAAQSAAKEAEAVWRAEVSAVEAQHGREVHAAEAAREQPTDRKTAYMAEKEQMQREMPPVLNARDGRAAAYRAELPGTATDPQREMPPVLNARKEAVAQQKQEAERSPDEKGGEKEQKPRAIPSRTRDWGPGW